MVAEEERCRTVSPPIHRARNAVLKGAPRRRGGKQVLLRLRRRTLGPTRGPAGRIRTRGRRGRAMDPRRTEEPLRREARVDPPPVRAREVRAAHILRHGRPRARPGRGRRGTTRGGRPRERAPRAEVPGRECPRTRPGRRGGATRHPGRRRRVERSLGAHDRRRMDDAGQSSWSSCWQWRVSWCGERCGSSAG